MMKNIGMVLLTCTLLAGINLSAMAQVASLPDLEECKSYVQSVFGQAEREDVNQVDILQFIVTTARLGRECYGERRPDNVVWLLNNEVFALDLLGRYDEASALVSLFFDEYFEDASDLFRGRMYQWRVQYLVYEGRYDDAATAYGEALGYDGALTLAQRAVLRNDGAVMRIRREDFEGAARLTTEGIALLDSTYRLRDEGIILAKLLQNRGHARLATFEDDSTSLLLDQARPDLEASITLRDSLSITLRQAEAYVTLGEIYHALGDGPAGRGSVGRGLALARDDGNRRGEIFALWRMGRLNRRNGAPSLAHEQLQRALDRSQESSVGEFELFILLELGRLYEDGEAWRRAEGYYRAVVESPDEARYRSSLYDAAKARDEAERRRVAVRMHLAEAEARSLRLALIGSVLLILLLGGAFALQWRRTTYLQRRYAVLRNGTPKDDDLFERRRRYAYRVLTRPDDVAEVLGETVLSALLAAGLEHRMQLFACIAALEERIDGHVIEVKNMRRFLHKQFKKRGWEWPESVEGWREHFQEHPL